MLAEGRCELSVVSFERRSRGAADDFAAILGRHDNAVFAVIRAFR